MKDYRIQKLEKKRKCKIHKNDRMENFTCFKITLSRVLKTNLLKMI